MTVGRIIHRLYAPYPCMTCPMFGILNNRKLNPMYNSLLRIAINRHKPKLSNAKTCIKVLGCCTLQKSVSTYKKENEYSSFYKKV